MRRYISAEPEAAERTQASKFTDDLSAETEKNDERSCKVDDNDNKSSSFCRRLQSESRYVYNCYFLAAKQFWKLQRFSWLQKNTANAERRMRKKVPTATKSSSSSTRCAVSEDRSLARAKCKGLLVLHHRYGHALSLCSPARWPLPISFTLLSLVISFHFVAVHLLYASVGRSSAY